MPHQADNKLGYLEEYKLLLTEIDWYYDRSDDHTYWYKHNQKWQRICQLQPHVDKDREIYAQYTKK